MVMDSHQKEYVTIWSLSVYKNICVIGLGYIGLPTAAFIASKGFNVNGFDNNEDIVSTINKGKIHIVEPLLEDLVSKVIKNKKLFASSSPSISDVYLIAVPTPFRNDKNRISPDISFVESAINSISMLLKRGDLVIIESTSPVGTTEHVKDMLASLRKDLEMPTEDERGDICIAYCPERVLPGNILHELQFNDRIIGGISKSCGEAARRFYKNFTNGDCHITNSRTAELAKLVENASRDSQIAFANEISMICDKLNINVWNLIKLANKHPRVNILNPGPGVGGHCIAVDPWFIVHGAPEESKFIECARNVNNTKPHWVINKIFKTLESLKKITKQINTQ